MLYDPFPLAIAIVAGVYLALVYLLLMVAQRASRLTNPHNKRSRV